MCYRDDIRDAVEKIGEDCNGGHLESHSELTMQPKMHPRQSEWTVLQMIDRCCGCATVASLTAAQICRSQDKDRCALALCFSHHTWVCVDLVMTLCCSENSFGFDCRNNLWRLWQSLHVHGKGVCLCLVRRVTFLLVQSVPPPCIQWCVFDAH